MLDRKTKDIDADVELLEDRIKREIYTTWMWVIGAIVLICASVIIQTRSNSVAILIGGLALVPLFMAIINLNYKKSLDILLYLKRQFEKKKE